MTPLLRRVVAEKRTVLLPLAIALIANLLVYALVVRPLAARSAGAADRAAAARSALGVAERDLAQAQALVNGKSRADEELNAFYEKVLPGDLTSARRMTYASLPALARKSNVQYEQRNTEVGDVNDDDRLGRMTIRMVFQGRYENLREFIYRLESSPEFVIIDEMTLTGSDREDVHALTMSLSTYYRARQNGA
jgi:hypothetical protein